MQVVAPPPLCAKPHILFVPDRYVFGNLHGACGVVVGEGGERVGAGGGRAGCVCAHWSGELLIHVGKDGL